MFKQQIVGLCFFKYVFKKPQPTPGLTETKAIGSEIIRNSLGMCVKMR